MKLNERIIFSLLHFLSYIARRMNPSERIIWAQKIGGFAFHYIPVRKSMALKNISKAFPEKSLKWKILLLKKCYAFVLEQFLFFLGFPESFEQTNIEVQNKSVVDKAIREKKGVLYISGHFGFWECIVAWFGKQNYPMTGVAHIQKNKGAHQFFTKKREWSGIKHVFRYDSMNKMNNVLDRGEILGLVSDQDAKGRGVFVRFFNILSSTPKGAARFFQRKGSIPVFGVCSKEGHNKFLIKFSDIPKNSLKNTKTFTQAYTQLLENEIRIHPEQYFWWHNRWKTPPPN